MDLILWRHAEAEEGAPDVARRLTPRGLRQAAQMGSWLAARLPQDSRILVSPAERAQQTAAALVRPFVTHGGIAPGATVDALFDATGSPGPDVTVLVVGHQPTLGGVVSVLLTGVETFWSIPTSGLWWLDVRGHGRDSVVSVRAVIAADML